MIDRSVMGLVGMKGNLTMAEEEMTKMDTALAGLDPTAASTGTTMMLVAAKFKEAGYSADEIAGRLPQVTNQFRQMAQEVGVASISNEDMVRWMQGIEPASVTAAKALAELVMLTLTQVRLQHSKQQHCSPCFRFNLRWHQRL